MGKIRAIWAMLLAMILFGFTTALAFADEIVDGAEETHSSLGDADPSLVRNVNFENWELILGFIQPLVLEFILQSKWTARAQSIAAFVFTLATTAVGLLLQDQFDLTNWFGSALKVFAVTIPAYYGLWRHVTGNLKANTDVT